MSWRKTNFNGYCLENVTIPVNIITIITPLENIDTHSFDSISSNSYHPSIPQENEDNNNKK